MEEMAGLDEASEQSSTAVVQINDSFDSDYASGEEEESKSKRVEAAAAAENHFYCTDETGG